MKFSIRILINWLSLAIFLLSLYYVTQGELIVALGYMLLALVTFLPRIVYRRLEFHKHFSNQMLDLIEITFSITVAMSVFGYLWLFDTLFDYDVYVHFFSPLALFIIIALFLSGLAQKLRIERVSKADIILATLVIIITLILLWEIFEYFVTEYTSKDMFFDWGLKDDTLMDVISGFLALPIGSVIIYKYHDWFFDKLRLTKKEKNDESR